MSALQPTPPARTRSLSRTRSGKIPEKKKKEKRQRRCGHERLARYAHPRELALSAAGTDTTEACRMEFATNLVCARARETEV